MKTRKNLRPNIAAPVARTTNSTSSSKGGAMEASWMTPGSEDLPFPTPFAGDDAE